MQNLNSYGGQLQPACVVEGHIFEESTKKFYGALVQNSEIKGGQTPIRYLWGKCSYMFEDVYGAYIPFLLL